MDAHSTCSSCNDSHCHDRDQRPGESDEDFRDRQALRDRMGLIKYKLLVLSGKGGVGKSTVATNLATSLALAGKRVGLLDVDIHGPSVPKLLHLEGRSISGSPNALNPVTVTCGSGMLSVMSIAFLLEARDDAVVWRGPRKFGVIRQFLKDVEWGELDYLVVDSPPGTGDEPLAVVQLLQNADGAVVVTTPQEVAVQDVRRCITFCRQLHLPVLGVVENMSGFTCPSCGELVQIFGIGGGRAMAEEMNVPFLGCIPLELETVVSGDSGVPMVQRQPHSETAQAFGRIVRVLLEPELRVIGSSDDLPCGKRPFRIAVPVTDGVLSTHFGHCQAFLVVDVQADGRTVRNRRLLTPPPHEPGTFPRWLHDQGVDLVIAGGLGSRAQCLFAENGISVVVGATNVDPDLAIRDFLEGHLQTGANACDH